MKLRLCIKEVRKAQQATLDDLADALGKSRATAHRYETGKVQPTLDDLAKIAARLNVTIPALWVDDEEESPHA